MKDVIKDGVEYVYRTSFNLTELVLPQSAKYIHCSNNHIFDFSLVLPYNFIRATCDLNAINPEEYIDNGHNYMYIKLIV